MHVRPVPLLSCREMAQDCVRTSKPHSDSWNSHCERSWQARLQNVTILQLWHATRSLAVDEDAVNTLWWYTSELHASLARFETTSENVDGDDATAAATAASSTSDVRLAEATDEDEEDDEDDEDEEDDEEDEEARVEWEVGPRISPHI